MLQGQKYPVYRMIYIVLSLCPKIPNFSLLTHVAASAKFETKTLNNLKITWNIYKVKGTHISSTGVPESYI